MPASPLPSWRQRCVSGRVVQLTHVIAVLLHPDWFFAAVQFVFEGGVIHTLFVVFWCCLVCMQLEAAESRIAELEAELASLRATGL